MKTRTERRSQYPQILDLPSGYRVVYREWGNGRPLVMLHGLMGSHRHWLGLMQKLKRHYRCISIDLLGFGESSQPKIEYGVAAEVAFVREVVQALGLSNYCLMGHSFGGWVAAAYALEYQVEMSGLVLLAPAGIRDTALSWHYRRRLPLMWPMPVVDWVLGAARPVATWLGMRDRLEATIALRKALLAQPVARQMVRNRSRSAGAIATVEAQIHQIELPTLVVAADGDETIPLWHCQMYGDRIPNARLEVVPNSSHRLPLDHWREILPMVRALLDSTAI